MEGEYDVKAESNDNDNEYYGDEQQGDHQGYQDFTADDGVEDQHLNGEETGGGGDTSNNEANGNNQNASNDGEGGNYDDQSSNQHNEEDDDESNTNGKPKNKDDDKRKLFVGGLSWDTKEKDLKEYFSKFGEVEGLTYKTDAVTGRPRGFAFIIFTDLSAVEQVLACGEHVINGKKVDPKRAKARPGKIFVGGLNADISNDDVKDYFSQYGTVIDMEVPIDKSTNQRKNYCFVTFDDIAISQELLKTPRQTICGKEVDVKQAVPMATNRPQGGGGWSDVPPARGGGRGRGGGGMRGRGAWGGGGYGAGAGTGYAPDYSWGGGYGGAYGGYDGYGGYYQGYEGYGGGYDAYAPPRARGRGGFGGKIRGAGRGGVPRHTPY